MIYLSWLSEARQRQRDEGRLARRHKVWLMQEEENLEFHSTTGAALTINCVLKYLERGFGAYAIKT